LATQNENSSEEKSHRKKNVKLCVMIPEDLDWELRTFLPAKKGEISNFIVEAIKEKLELEKRKLHPSS
jgi:hypothetical protein